MKLILHIGASETGAGRIQSALRTQSRSLQAQGVLHLGQLFEHGPARLFDWQRAGAGDAFFALPTAEAERQLQHLLEATLRHARAAGMHTLVWSNAALFHRFEPLLPPLQGACAQGLQLAVLAYVRPHADWARSIYLERGLKHKPHPGRLRSFGQWVSQRKPLFAPTLARFEQALPGCLAVRNAATVDDVAADFWHVAELREPPPAPGAQVPQADDTELFLRSLFNDRHERGGITADDFDQAIGSLLPRAASPAGFMQALYPSAQDIQAVVQDAHEDRLAVDALLLQQGQPALLAGTTAAKAPEIDEDRLLGALAQLCMANARRIESLEAQGHARQGKEGGTPWPKRQSD